WLLWRRATEAPWKLLVSTRSHRLARSEIPIEPASSWVISIWRCDVATRLTAGIADQSSLGAWPRPGHRARPLATATQQRDLSGCPQHQRKGPARQRRGGRSRGAVAIETLRGSDSSRGGDLGRQQRVLDQQANPKGHLHGTANAAPLAEDVGAV